MRSFAVFPGALVLNSSTHAHESATIFKAVILGPQQAQKYGANLPPDLNEEAKTSNNYSQYCPGQTLWVCRAQDLP